MLRHAGEGVRVLQLGVDDAQAVVGVAEIRVHHPPCNSTVTTVQYSTVQYSQQPTLATAPPFAILLHALK